MPGGRLGRATESSSPRWSSWFPTSQAVLASIDWDAKEQLATAKEEERALKRRAWLDAIEAHRFGHDL
jgi:hypothetical protein